MIPRVRQAVSVQALSFAITSSFFFFSLLSELHAEDAHLINVKLRAVKAEGALPTWERISEEGVEGRIKDLMPKFANLPQHYSKYSLMCERVEQIPLAMKKVFPLSNGHRVMLRPRGKGKDRVVNVRWVNSRREVLLDTVMAYPKGHASKPLVAGVPLGDSGEGVILSIDMQPAAR